MTDKRFKERGDEILQNGEVWAVANCPHHAEVIAEALNIFVRENERLKKELRIYREVASCRNCHYHNYDWYDDGDEFEVCDIGNDVTEGICKEWRKL